MGRYLLREVLLALHKTTEHTGRTLLERRSLSWILLSQPRKSGPQLTDLVIFIAMAVTLDKIEELMERVK